MCLGCNDALGIPRPTENVKPLTLNEYQEKCAETWLYPGNDPVGYCMFGLAGEVGEAINKLKKVLRGDWTLEDAKRAIALELGDALWYLGRLAKVLGFSLEEIARMNLEKCASRHARGAVKGTGDER